jgi:hypothetical protein
MLRSLRLAGCMSICVEGRGNGLHQRRLTFQPRRMVEAAKRDNCSQSDIFKSYLLISAVRKLTVIYAGQLSGGFQIHLGPYALSKNHYNCPQWQPVGGVEPVVTVVSVGYPNQLGNGSLSIGELSFYFSGDTVFGERGSKGCSLLQFSVQRSNTRSREGDFSFPIRDFWQRTTYTRDIH